MRRTVVEMVVPEGISADAFLGTLEQAIKQAYGRNVKAYKRHVRNEGPSMPRVVPPTRVNR